MKIIDVTMLHNVKKSNGEVIAQCPACVAAGGDETGNHLKVYPDGKFNCVVKTKNKKHNQEILNLVGIEDGKQPEKPKVKIRPHRVLPPAVIMDVPRKTLEELGLIRDPQRRVILRP